MLAGILYSIKNISSYIYQRGKSYIINVIIFHISFSALRAHWIKQGKYLFVC